MKKVLLVEDDVLIALASKMELEKAGYLVETACDGLNAISIVREHPDIDIVLMDIDLGTGMDGTEAAHEILKIRSLPVVFVSSHTEPAIIAKTEAITSYGYIVKNSAFIVYDASIKMAFKLFNAQKDRIQFERILTSSLDYLPQAIFISDTKGNLTHMNEAYAKIQKFNSRSECISSLDRYPDVFDVYTKDGHIASIDQWALPRALSGEVRENEKYYIVRKDIKDVWIGHYSFGPIRDCNKAIIGAIVTIIDATSFYPEDKYFRQISDKY